MHDPWQKPLRGRSGASRAAGSRSGEVVSGDTWPNLQAAAAAVSLEHSLRGRPMSHAVLPDMTWTFRSPAVPR
jgi:hypothetical protein